MTLSVTNEPDPAGGAEIAAAAKLASDRRSRLSVLALDLVSFSLEFDEVQERMVRVLGELVQEVKRERQATATVLPTGDGALVAFDSGRAADAIHFAEALQRKLNERLLRLPIRMAVHCGSGIAATDTSGQPNYVGTVLNLAQRVMDLGDEGHLLLSGTAAEELLSHENHAPFVRRLSSSPVAVKHGVVLEVFNYVSPVVGVNVEPRKAAVQSEFVHAQVTRRPTWSELFSAAPLIRGVDLSWPLLGTPALLDHFESLLRTELCEIRLLILDPSSVAAYQRRTSSAYKAIDELQVTIGYAIQILHGLRSSLARYGDDVLSRFDVRLLETLPSFSGVIAGDRALISIYTAHLSASRGPYLEFLRNERAKPETSVVACLEQSFDAQWTQSPSLFDPRLPELLADRSRQTQEFLAAGESARSRLPWSDA